MGLPIPWGLGKEEEESVPPPFYTDSFFKPSFLILIHFHSESHFKIAACGRIGNALDDAYILS